MAKRFLTPVTVTVSTGTAPFTVSSTTVVTNLNADLLDGQHGSYYAPKASPALTGTPTAPTATSGTNTTQIATTAFVSTALSGAGGATVSYQVSAPSSPSIGDIWVDSDEPIITLNSNDFMPKSGGTFTGAVSGITPTLSTHLTTKDYVDNNIPAPTESGFNAFFLGGM